MCLYGCVPFSTLRSLHRQLLFDFVPYLAAIADLRNEIRTHVSPPAADMRLMVHVVKTWEKKQTNFTYGLMGNNASIVGNYTQMI
ncbi:hypothetical protein DPMN_045012 [Dreissena polymorpha]|uniref:Uncharacterized protein n=1 Tax=Dreissena polymorpha TaxID=45954 RepID=A0A9D4D6X7_DREPO|nr:hypothetical protein DPMN_045012 [Dreissena polymorpha]